MGFVEPAMVVQLAESLAVPPLSEDAAKALAPHIDVRLREIVQEACKFARHAKRKRLTTEDVNDALRLRGCEPLYGFGGRDPARFVRAAGHPELIYLQDLELPVDKAAEQALPRAPVRAGLAAHWLAIDGVQPRIPENARVERPRLKRPAPAAPQQQAAAKQQRLDKGAKAGAGGEQGGGGEQAAAPVVPPVRLVASLELQRILEEVQQALAAAAAGAGAFGGLPPAQPPGDEPAAPAAAAAAAAADPQAQRQRRLLALLTCDTGLHPIVPALVSLVSEQVASAGRQLPQLRLLIEVVRSLLRNPDVHLELYLEGLLPPLLTCVLTKRLGDGGGGSGGHWGLREAAAGAVALLVARYGGQPGGLRQRVARQLVTALADPGKSLACHYGAIAGLACLGRRCVQLLLLPLAPAILARLQGAAAAGGREPLQRAEAARVTGALRAACAGCLWGCMTDRLSRAFFASLAQPRLPPAAAKLDSGAQGTAATPAAAAAAAGERKARAARQAAGPGRGGQAGKAPAAAAAAAAERAGAAAASGEEADAWREDAGLGRNLAAVSSEFGDAVLPFAPWLPLDHVSL